MKTLTTIMLVASLAHGCKEETTNDTSTEAAVSVNKSIVDELARMVEVDQIAAYVPQGKYADLTEVEWESFKDSVFVTHQKRLQQMYNEYGFIGFDIAGKDGSQNFWLMVQHSDHDPKFQRQVLEAMKLEIQKGNADPKKYGMLVDRVNLNEGSKQVYGTQVSYNTETGQAYAHQMQDSLRVDERRSSVGLEPLNQYLNSMTKMHFDMNKSYYVEKGLTEPKLYAVEVETRR